MTGQQKQAFVKKASEIIRKPFLIDKENEESIAAITQYFTKHAAFEQSKVCKNPSLDKGLILIGNVGAGKTVILRTFSKLTPFRWRTARGVSQEFAEQGQQVITDYGRKSTHTNGNQIYPIHTAFDDLGFEENVVYFGNRVNVMQEILADRYEQWCDKGMKTYATTNMDAEAIQTAYGDKVRSRLREMCNFIHLTGNDRRK